MTTSVDYPSRFLRPQDPRGFRHLGREEHGYGPQPGRAPARSPMRERPSDAPVPSSSSLFGSLTDAAWRGFQGAAQAAKAQARGAAGRMLRAAPFVSAGLNDRGGDDGDGRDDDDGIDREYMGGAASSSAPYSAPSSESRFPTYGHVDARRGPAYADPRDYADGTRKRSSSPARSLGGGRHGRRHGHHGHHRHRSTSRHSRSPRSPRSPFHQNQAESLAWARRFVAARRAAKGLTRSKRSRSPRSRSPSLFSVHRRHTHSPHSHRHHSRRHHHSRPHHYPAF